MASMYKRGWFQDSTRHSLAAKGIKTNFYARKTKTNYAASKGEFKFASWDNHEDDVRQFNLALDKIRKNERRQREILSDEPFISDIIPSSVEHENALSKEVRKLDEEFNSLDVETRKLREYVKYLSDRINPPEEDEFMSKKTSEPVVRGFKHVESSAKTQKEFEDELVREIGAENLEINRDYREEGMHHRADPPVTVYVDKRLPRFMGDHIATWKDSKGEGIIFVPDSDARGVMPVVVRKPANPDPVTGVPRPPTEEQIRELM